MDEMINGIKRAVESEIMAGVNEIYLQAEPKKNTGKKMTLKTLEEEVSGCLRCELSGTRTNVVFGEGDSRADLMFIGEAPGGDEDKQGRPFVGRAGQLLTKIIESIGLKREEVFIGNILKCRPPGNRNPMPNEIAMCSPYLLKQIDAIEPKVICALGKFAAQTLLNTETPISKLRGKFYDYNGIKLMPTYHPAYLLRNSSGKKEVWQDMQAIAKELGLKIPRRREHVQK
ncbi:MAG: uracil-DNA glycosylase [Candidatus Omnitrophota bacterium]